MKVALIKKKVSLSRSMGQHMQELLTALAGEGGHEVHLFAGKGEEKGEFTLHRVRHIPFPSLLSLTTFNSSATRSLKKAGRMDCVISLERTDCQDIYLAGEGCHAEWLRIRSRTEPLHKRLSFRVSPLHLSLLSLEKKIFRETKRIVANSEMVKRQIMAHYAVPEERISVIYHGVDLQRFSPANRGKWRQEVRERLKVGEETKLLLFIGSGFERKGLPAFIDALALVKHADIKAMVIGRGDSCTYRSITRDKGIGDRVVFIEPKKEIEKFHSAADLFVLPTLYDPFSNATLEAMASGLPVITSANNWAAELIEDGQEGYVLNNMSDSEELAEKISLCMTETSSMGIKARQKAEGIPVRGSIRQLIALVEAERP